MTAGKERGALLPGLMALLVLVGASMAGASRPAVPDMVTHAKQVVFGGGSESAPVPGAEPTATGSSGSGSGEAGSSQGRGSVGRHGHATSGDPGDGAKGVGPTGVPTSHAGGNGKDHAGGNGNGNGKDHAGGNGNGKGTPPPDPGGKGQAPSPLGSPVKRHKPH